jgi:hypothetical protein
MEDNMAIGESMLAEFDIEMSNTRKTLERVPDDKFSWKPHEKSFPMGALATHLANLPSWTNVTIDLDEFDMAPGGEKMTTPECHSQKELLEVFDANVGKARAALAGISDQRIFQPWSLLVNGREDLFNAAHCSATQLCYESRDSSSSPAWCLLAP